VLATLTAAASLRLLVLAVRYSIVSMGWFTRVVLAAALVVLGLLSCAYGALILASIPVSDTATVSLIAFGLGFAVPGLAVAGIGAWLLRRDLHRGHRASSAG
jgi:hypothetical protein